MRLGRRRRPEVAIRTRPPAGAPPEARPARPVTPVGEPEPPELPGPAPRRGPLLLALMVAVVIVGAAVAFTIFQSQDSEDAVPATVPPVIGESQSVLMVVAGEGGRATSVALFTSDGADQQRVLVAPRDLTMQIPGYGEGTVGDALLFEDANLVRLSLMNEIGIRIDSTITIRPGEVARILGDAVRIDLPSPFIIDTADGEVVSASAGSDVFVPETAETLLVTQGADTPLDWLQRQRAVWEALARQVADAPGPAAAISPTFTAIAEQLDTAVVSVLPVDRVGVGISELYVVSRTSDLLTDRISYLAMSETARPRVEILNATIFPAVTRPLAEILIEDGFRIIKTDNAEERFRPDTLIIAQGIGSQRAALDAQSLIGGGEVVVQSSGSGVVDVSIIVGRDVARP